MPRAERRPRLCDLERTSHDEDLFLAICANDPLLPPRLRHLAVLTGGGACEFSTAWVHEQGEKLASGELDTEETEMLRAVVPYAARELYGSCTIDNEGLVG